VARVAPGTELEVVARKGAGPASVWRGGPGCRPGQHDPPEGAPVAALKPQDLASNPTAHRGRVVNWELQFISLEHAEKVRTDFFEGEPFS